MIAGVCLLVTYSATFSLKKEPEIFLYVATFSSELSYMFQLLRY